jgi:beta-lactamase regulating signal transducer with metallopeptidase domain
VLGLRRYGMMREGECAQATPRPVPSQYCEPQLHLQYDSNRAGERERACDEEVLELGSERQVYAESILKTCECCVESPPASVSGISGSDLKKRIVRIMT